MSEHPSHVPERVETSITSSSLATTSSTLGSSILYFGSTDIAVLLAARAFNESRKLHVGEDIEVVGNNGWQNTIDSKEVFITDGDHR